MSAGIGSIGSAGNIQMSSVAKNTTDNILMEINKKKKHGGNTPFDVMLVNLNAQNASSIQTGSNGQTGTRINKFA